MGRPPGCKLIRITADIVDGVIRRLSIRGDFFAVPEEGFDRAESRMAGLPLSGAGNVFDSFLVEEGVEAAGINGAGIEALLRAETDKLQGGAGAGADTQEAYHA